MLIDLGIYLVFFIFGILYWLDMDSNRKSELFIHHDYQKEILKQVQDDGQGIQGKTAELESGSRFVASSRGKYFYPINCPQGQGLSEKNKIFFDTMEEAQKAGFKEYKC